MKESKTTPPHLAERLLQLFLRTDLAEEVLGDLEEKFYTTLKKKSAFRAKVNYWYQVLNYIRPFALKKSKVQNSNNYGMLKNYFKVSTRNILRQKTYSLLNMAGLSIGMACCVLILIYVNHELSYDTYHDNYKSTYRIVQSFRTDKEFEAKPFLTPQEYQVWGCAPVGIALANDFPEVKDVFRFTFWSFLMEAGDKKFQEDQNILFADSTAFTVFSWNLISGNPKTALKEPKSIVLTESLAEKYFGSSDPMGQLITIDNQDAFKVTGVMEDVPGNSHFSFEAMVSMTTMHGQRAEIFDWWGYVDFYTYFTLHEGAQIESLREKIPAFLERHLTDWKGYQMEFETLSDAYLHSVAGRQPGTVGSMNNIFIYSSIAVFILIIACINFMNLATARSVERAKEVGIRKTIGSRSGALIIQFLLESILMTLASGLVAAVIVVILLPYLELLSDKTLSVSWMFSFQYISLGILGLLVVGILSGSYPAFVLSKFQVLQVLKGSFKSSNEGIWLRKSLVVFQFALSLMLIVGTSVVFSQLKFLKDHKLGFNTDHMLILSYDFDPKIQQHLDFIKSRLKNHPDVKSVCAARTVPGGFFPNAGTGIENPIGEVEFHNPALFEIDRDFIPNYEMDMVAGRNFSLDFPSDSVSALILNEAAAKLYGYPNPKNVIGKKYSQWGREGKVIGVVRDFNYVSLHSRVEPLSMRYEPASTANLSLRINSDNIGNTLSELEILWAELAPHRPFNYSFLDNSFQSQYQEDERFSKVFSIFSGLAIFIACMGLFGLTIYSTLQRTKEIGIRKVMGASVANIVSLLTKDFVWLFLIALVLAAPVSWFGMQKWLDTFAYSIEMSWEMVFLSAFISLSIAMVTMSLKTISAAQSNPVDSLRNE